VAEIGKYINKLSELIKGSENILLVCHVNPDGDAVGSMLAMYHYLTARGKQVKMLSPNYLQDFLQWMTGADLIQIYLRNRKKSTRIVEAADLIMFLDFNNRSRLGDAEKLILSSPATKVIIDHHVDPQDIAETIISEPSCCATAELVYMLAEGLDGKPFSEPAFNEAVYVGIVTDTGNFEHGSYTGNTMRIVASLIDEGVDKERVFDSVYNNFSPERMRLQGLALFSRMKILPEHSAAYIWLTRDDLKDFNYSKGDTEGFVNMPLSIRGISVAALFVEKEGFIKVSLRSKGEFSVNDFAVKYFSGGGHRNAAGGEYYKSLESALSYFETSIDEFVTNNTINNK
jgi:bifunctional oligoribonuclease and PAP phosphatase NrnA